MKTKTTALWFVFAAALAAFIWLYETKLQPAPPVHTALLAGLRAADVTAIQIIPAGGWEISAVRTNGVWQLEKPLAYPAQAAAIQALLASLEQLSPILRLTAAEMQGRKNADSEFGFENPQFKLDLTAGDQNWYLTVGNLTAPGDGVYVRVGGEAGAYVTDTDWLRLLPREATAWRDTGLVDVVGKVDWLVITNGTRVIELRRNATNHLWRMTSPLDARANNLRIVTALQQLSSAKVSQFVTDNPKADLTAYGLQPAALDVWLGSGTNYLAAVHVGKDSPDHPGEVFAQREDWSSVLTVASNTFAAWRGTVNDFRDPRLLNFTGPVAEIDVRGTNGFTLKADGANGWRVAGEKFPVDEDSLKEFVQLLANLPIAEFVKDLGTATDLQGYGISTNSRAIILRFIADDTNSVKAQLVFGTAGTNRIFVKRGDEGFVYALALDDYKRLPEYGWEFRDRRIWNFSETNVSEITLHQGGKTRQILRTGANSWSLMPGSQGIINPLAIEETVRRLGQLDAIAWAGRNFPTPETFGLDTNNLDLLVELKNGEKRSVDFGGIVPGRQTVYAAVTLDGERWIFEFPPALCALVAAYLTIPQKDP
ncbi:MAG TPA: DUF4340 domain-containing protein [Verrucomicrobiae bacterium]